MTFLWTSNSEVERTICLLACLFICSFVHLLICFRFVLLALMLFDTVLHLSYGTVYKGTWNGSTVAVKRYNTYLPSNDAEARNFFNFRNDYIVGFRGICCSLNALVLEYCKHGSVQSWFNKGKLTDELKLLICYDCAKGMEVPIRQSTWGPCSQLTFSSPTVPSFKQNYPS